MNQNKTRCSFVFFNYSKFLIIENQSVVTDSKELFLRQKRSAKSAQKVTAVVYTDKN